MSLNTKQASTNLHLQHSKLCYTCSSSSAIQHEEQHTNAVNEKQYITCLKPCLKCGDSCEQATCIKECKWSSVSHVSVWICSNWWWENAWWQM